jgi:UDP-N-acetylglucosamine 2-epimerase (non-hydrolysing)/UDP-GlcNAc3NAcA epimerase
MKIVTVIGARPQFIKAAAVSRELRKLHHEVLIHTGQHYDKNMSDVFFKELDIPVPDYNLSVGSNTHAKQTAEMMIGIEKTLVKEKPDTVLIYGDTNSTLAGAVTAGKLNIPIAHVEAGGRTFVRDMPEEQNRIVADHLATWNFTASEEHARFLQTEGITEHVYNVGDVMYDGLLFALDKILKTDKIKFLKKLEYIVPNKNPLSKWYTATLHRPENVDDIIKVKSIIKGFDSLDLQVVFTVHPRTVPKILALTAEREYNNIHFVKPLSYLTMIFFAKNSRKIITDSGGLQKEAFLMKVPSVVVLRSTGWRETLIGNCNVLAKPDGDDIMDKLYNTDIDYSNFNIPYYGDGTASKQISKILSKGI